MKQNKKVELLAPAGNKEAFYGAIHAGADAVYLGGSRFGARAYADNFTEEELIACIRYAHLWGRKVYLTVNTLVKEAELLEIYDYLLPFYEVGLDGVIVQDIGVLAYIRERFPELELHVSTQMTITGKYGAGLLREMGACRVVPARELSLAEIIELKAVTGLDVECFIHGAMCYCYSGQCLFSSILGGRSGNRGRCAQPCRLPYRVENGGKITQECYPLSLKDMCTIEHIPELIQAGIDSFKIEGRMKKPEYAAGVTAIYRKYIDAYYSAPKKPFRVSQEDLQKLSCLYIRSERQDGYYHKHNGREMVTLSQPSYSGSDDALLNAIRRTYLEQAPKRQIAIYGSFVAGEAASVTFSLEDFSVTVEGSPVQRAQKQPISLSNVEKQLQKLGDSIFCAGSIEIYLDGQVFYPLKEINELRRRAIAQLEEQLLQKNGFPVHRSPASFEKCSASQCAKSSKGLGESAEAAAANTVPMPMYTVSVRTAAQLDAVLPYLARLQTGRLYINSDLFFKNHSLLQTLKGPAAEAACEIILSLPYICRLTDEAYLEELLGLAEEHSAIVKGFQVRCLEEMGFLKSRNYQGKIYADAGFYIWNSRTLKEWKQSLAGFCIPYELRASEQKALENFPGENLSIEKVCYGRIPMMITANCVVRTTGGCQKERMADRHGAEREAEKKASDTRAQGAEKKVADTRAQEAPVQLLDRYHKSFPVVLDCEHCMNIIYNSVPLSLHNEWKQWRRQQPNIAARLDFTVENAAMTHQVLDFFHTILENESVGGSHPPYKDYTTGHEKRGVE